MRLKYLIIFAVIALISFLTYKFFFIERYSNQNNIRLTTPKLLEKQKGLISYSPQEKQREEDVNRHWSNFVYPAQVKMRDPFRRHEEQIEVRNEKETSPSFVMLTGVLYNEQNPIAIFVDKKGNSYLVDEKKKNKILDYTVKKILKRSVILRQDETDIEFKVFDEENLLDSKTQSQQLSHNLDNSATEKNHEMVSGRREATIISKKNETKSRKESGVKLMEGPLNDESYDHITPAIQQRVNTLLNQKHK